MIFVRTKIRADRIAETLKEYGFQVESLHKDLSPARREHIVDQFKQGLLQVCFFYFFLFFFLICEFSKNFQFFCKILRIQIVDDSINRSNGKRSRYT